MIWCWKSTKINDMKYLQSHGTSSRNTSPAVKEHFVPAGSEFIIPEEIPHQFSGDTFQKTVLVQRADGPN